MGRKRGRCRSRQMKQYVPQRGIWEEEDWKGQVPSCLDNSIHGSKCAGVPDFSTGGRKQTRNVITSKQRLQKRNGAM